MAGSGVLRVAVIGVGYLGRFHAQKYAAMEGVELVAVADLDEERARTVAQEVGCRAVTDFRELLGEIDAASVVVPTVHHHRVALPLLERGVHCLVEKPLTATLEEADELIEAAERQGVVLQVGHLERFNPAVEFLSGRVTTPLFIEAHRLSGFKERSIDVDVVLDLMIHDIDIVLSLVDSPVKEIRAVGVPVLTPRVDIANARIIFEDGCNANLTASRISLQAMRRIRVFQPGAYISADCAEQRGMMVTTDPTRRGMEAIRPEFCNLPRRDILMDELQAFVEAVREGAPPRVDGRAGRAALAMAMEINGVIRAQLARQGLAVLG